MKTHATTKNIVMTKLNENASKTQSGEDSHRRKLWMSGMKRILIGFFLAVGVMFLRHDASAGTRILNVVFRLDMVNSGVDTNASGKISGNLIRNASGSNQQLKLTLAKLDPNTAYHLSAFIGDGADLIHVADFMTDAKGAATVNYVQKCPGNSNRGGQPLPTALDPISHIHQLDIVNANGDVVLTGAIGADIQADCDAPTVSFTVPADGAHNVAIDQAITATFNEPMDAGTINRTAFTLKKGTRSVSGIVTFAGATAIFTPAHALESNTVYTATITTRAKDVDGNGLASKVVWSFTTAAATTGQAGVVLGASGGFAVLAGSTVTSTGNTTVNGDLGVSPGTAVTGFGPGIVNGAIHAGDTAAAQAQLDLTVAYNDAAGRTVGAVTIVGNLNLGGRTLAPGLYKSDTSLEISSGDLTLDAQGDANAVFIFQMGSTLTTTVGRQVILMGGAKAANIFWQVGSSATLGTTSVFKGTIMALASITLTTGATLDGRALARNAAVTMDSNTVTIPAP